MNNADIQKQIRFFIYDLVEPLDSMVKLENNFKLFFYILIFNLASLILFSCSSPTENNKVTFSGKVTLLAPSGADTSDYSPTEDSGFRFAQSRQKPRDLRFASTGVTVSFYKPVELPAGWRMPLADTALVRI